jgi:hypothetical protein
MEPWSVQRRLGDSGARADRRRIRACSPCLVVPVLRTTVVDASGMFQFSCGSGRRRYEARAAARPSSSCSGLSARGHAAFPSRVFGASDMMPVAHPRIIRMIVT